MSERKRIQFWGEHDDDDHLIREILRGEKTATVAKAADYHLPEGPYDTGGWEVGDLVDVYDLHGCHRCVIRVTEVYDVRFGHIPEKLWRGEVCTSAAHFQAAHRLCWPDEELTADFAMRAVHFELVAPADTEPG